MLAKLSQRVSEPRRRTSRIAGRFLSTDWQSRAARRAAACSHRQHHNLRRLARSIIAIGFFGSAVATPGRVPAMHQQQRLPSLSTAAALDFLSYHPQRKATAAAAPLRARLGAAPAGRKARPSRPPSGTCRGTRAAASPHHPRLNGGGGGQHWHLNVFTPKLNVLMYPQSNDFHTKPYVLMYQQSLK